MSADASHLRRAMDMRWVVDADGMVHDLWSDMPALCLRRGTVRPVDLDDSRWPEALLCPLCVAVGASGQR